MKKIKFYTDATEMGLPFIKIQEGEFKGLIFLIDTGSNDNILFGYAYQQLKDLLAPIESQNSLYGIDGKKTIMNLASGKMSFFGKEHEMVFLIREDDKAAKLLSQDMGFPICGILGTRFMLEHDWMINFAKQQIEVPEYGMDCSSIIYN